METPKIIKSIIPVECPDCKKNIYISHHFSPPTIAWVLKKEDIDSAKKNILEKINHLKLDEKTLGEWTKWINMDETLFGPDEVDVIINEIKNYIKNS